MRRVKTIPVWALVALAAAVSGADAPRGIDLAYIGPCARKARAPASPFSVLS